jgi:hypothetical protein
MSNQTLDFSDLLSYVKLKHNFLKYRFAHIRFNESDLIKILMASLMDKFKCSNSIEFYDCPITKKEIDEILDNYDFNQINNEIEFDFKIPTVLEEIETKVKIKNKGKIFLIHKNDADPFPSNPHAHWIDTNFKIDLRNGDCYHKSKLVSTLSKKEFNLLIEKIKNLGVELPKN